MSNSTAGRRAPDQIQTQAPYLPMGLDRKPNVRSCADPDAALVEALKKRNTTAFDQLLKRYGQRLLKTVTRITKNREDAEDVVQESFLKVFKNIESFRSDSKFSSWLTRIAINQALMLIRGRTRTFVSIDENTAAEGNHSTLEIPVCGYTPEQLCAQREFEDVMLNLKNVRKSSQRVMELRVKHELSDLEIAQALNLSLPAVKARLYRGRQDLREVMSRSFQPAKLGQSRLNIRTSIRKGKPRRIYIGVSALASGNRLPARYDQSSTELQSPPAYHSAPQLLTYSRGLQIDGPEIAF
jgi:RNA polymerase sigma-70 factor (ECF subfamily)